MRAREWLPGASLAMLAMLAAPLHAQDAPPVRLIEAQRLESLPKVKQRSLWQRLRRCQDGTDRSRGWLRHLSPNPDAPATPVFGRPCDVDWHKPIFFLPYTYSRDYESDQTEVLFSVSAKLRPLGPGVYLAYSQRSFWSVYDSSRSRPFRETVYNPEIFYRWVGPDPRASAFIWGLDGGYEHESNGQDIPESRSWDRLYVAPFFERGGTALQLKIWYRLPESDKKDDADANGDDNPDIQDYLGHGELHLHRRIGANRRLHVMGRMNAGTGHGAIQVDHSWRVGDGYLFWYAYGFHGYGESLTDYNDSVTRIGVGFSLAR